MYLLTAGIFSVVGTLMSNVVRYELSSSAVRMFAADCLATYNVFFTLHGLAMIFAFLMPALFSGFGNYFLPIYVGSAEVVLPRINAISYFLLPLGSVLLLHSFIAEFGAAVGWTLYAPLSTNIMSMNTEAVDWIILGLAFLGMSSVLGSVNFLGTSLFAGTVSSLRTGIPFVWAIIFTALMLLATIPVITGALLMLGMDLHLNYGFYDATLNGDSVLYQHLFWFFGHPEVYILILPGFGIISQCLSTACSRPVFGGSSVILAMGCIAVLGALVWAHHMMTAGLEVDTRAYFSAVTIMIAIPTGTKIFNWLGTYSGTEYAMQDVDHWAAIAFVALFSIGGTTGVVMGNGSLDIALHDTYYIVAHFHFVLSLGAVIATVCGLVYYGLDMCGESINTAAGYSIYMPIAKVWFVMFLASICGVFLPMHLMGFNIMPRRLPDYSDFMFYIHDIASLASISTIVLVWGLLF